MTKAWIPPLADTRFVLGELIDLDRAIKRAGNHVDRPGVDQILDEAARFATDVLTPLDRPGDATGARLENGTVVLPSGFAEAYGRFVEGGWNALASPAAIGGAGVPKALATAVAEYWTSASMAFGLCPLLTQSGIELLARHGTTAQRQTYLPNLVSGRWTATMCLTEAHAGSDVGALRTRAVRQGERWHVRGEDLHHLRRPRHGGEHRPSGTRAARRRAGRQQGPCPVRGAEVHSRQIWSARPPQRPARDASRTQARHPRQPYVPHGLWRSRGCRR